MSKMRTNGKNDPPSFAETVIPLMKEYSSKLRSATRELRASRERVRSIVESQVENTQDPQKTQTPKVQQFWHDRASALQTLDGQLCTPLQNLVPPARKLGQHVSQMINHGGLADLEKIELSLRLAELESTISVAQEMLQEHAPVHLLFV